MNEFHLLRPYWLLSLLPMLFVWLTIRRGQGSFDQMKKFVDPHLLEHLVVGNNNVRRVRPIHLIAAISVISAIALAGPSWEKEPSPFTDDDAGLIVLLKVSDTMRATDLQPSRLERAKHKLHDLLQQRRGSATGLIVYSGSAHLVMPLTTDDRIISTMVEDLTPDVMPIDGDALADALQLSEQILERAGSPGSVLVMTDSVSASQVEIVSAMKFATPVQFLAMSASSAPVDTGLQKTASTLGASVTRITFDPADVEQLSRRARSDFKATAGMSDGDRWRDTGFFMLPFIALLTLMWSRRGWVIR